MDLIAGIRLDEPRADREPLAPGFTRQSGNEQVELLR